MVKVAAKTDPDMSGTLLGNYKIIRLVGKGGVGSVYLAKNEKTGAIEALKMILPEKTDSAEIKERFGREIENMRSLDHPNILKFNEFGESRDICFYTMEYCKGGSMADLLKRNGGPLPCDMACKIMMQVLDGLDYAHNAKIPQVKMKDGSSESGCGLVHRDIKPENILVQTDGKSETMKISDFGLSKAFRLAEKCGNTQTGSVGGSLGFISRHQVLNFKYSKPEVDVWSAAAVLYFLLTGRTPRNCEGEKNLFNAVLKNNPVPIRKIAPSVPEKLASIIDRALDDRGLLLYKTASELRKDLLSTI